MRSAITLGLALLAGVIVTAGVLAAAVAFLPGPVRSDASPTPAVSAAPSSDTAGGSPVVSLAPSEGGSNPPASSGSPAASPGDSGGESPSAVPTLGDAAFGVGKPAPPIRLTTLDGTTVDLASLKGKPVWVNFMQTTCPPCQDEFPLMNGFALRYKDAGLTVLAVDIREDAAAVRSFTDHLGTLFPVALDPDGTAQRAWGALALPVHFWVDADGIVRAGALGGIGPDIMAEGLQKIMPGTTVTP